MTVSLGVRQLVEKFERNREAYLSPHYKEAQLRVEFLDSLFGALGWDVENKQGYPSDRSALERQITAIDRQIDELVYELYGLTADEIRIVEGSAS